jgi:hypothetical protein
VIQRLINGDLRSTVVTEEVLNVVAVMIMNGEDDPFTAGYRLYTRYKSDR